MENEGAGQRSGAPFEAEWSYEAIGDPDAPEAYRFTLANIETEEAICDVAIPVSAIATAVFGGRRAELIIDAEEGRLIVEGPGLDDSILDVLTSAFSNIRILSLAADVLESEGLASLGQHGSKSGELQAELTRLSAALSKAERQLGGG